MKTSSNKRFSRKHDRKVLVAEESTKSWADSDSDSSSSSSSSSDSEQEEVHCFMADQQTMMRYLYFSNVEFTRDDLVIALNDMVQEYMKAFHSFEEAKAENISLKNSSTESSSDELEDVDSLKTKLSRLTVENEMLKDETSELKEEIFVLKQVVSAWNNSARKLHKLQEDQKSNGDRTGIGFNSSNSSDEGPSTQSRPTYDKFNKMGFVKAEVIYDCCESIRYDDQDTSQPNLKGKGKVGVGYQGPENSKPGWLKNKLNKDKAKAGPKFFVPNQSRHYSKKAKTEWTRNQPRRNPYGQNIKSKFKRPARDFAHTFVDPRTGKTVRIVQIWVPKGVIQSGPK
ncbi:hypothetical protein F511_32273 [Dorcoceras hygrometricum]|uniref:Uncharacterized protein n=1 Tax=Dorcoceras hygrometricum TaxID=472368 RepID=A0A2Z7CIT6_9LAMI|nr:hypothetical protein F511_32273 [Dorcoceras hygrometricum]